MSLVQKVKLWFGDGLVTTANPLPVDIGTNVSVEVGASVEITNDAGNPIPVAPSASTYTDHSGTITAGGTAQNAVAVNASRRYLRVRNPRKKSDGSDNVSEFLWFRLTGTAAAGSPSTPLDIGDEFVWDSPSVPSNALSVFAATTGHAFVVEQG